MTYLEFNELKQLVFCYWNLLNVAPRSNYGMEDCCLPLLCKDDTGSPSYSVRTVVTILQASDLDALQKCCHTNTSGTGYGFRMDLCNAALESVKVLTCWNGSNRTWEIKCPVDRGLGLE